jgi:2-polyprenyl-3-methyl-5-hydroxy-6-metoxy-1,4-benzoquinol methylase
MNTTQEHYNRLLGGIYSWMIGDTDTALERNRCFFRQLALDSAPKGLAVDLGCGLGLQSIGLAELGFSVLAVDTCATLLCELRSSTANFPIQTIHDDLLNFTKHLNKQAQLVI